MASTENIGFLCSGQSWGGLEMHVLNTAVWLKDTGLSVHIITHCDSPLYSRALQAKLLAHRFSASSKLGAAIESLSLSRICREHRLGTVVLHTRRDLPGVVLAKRLGGKFKLVYQQHMQLGGNKTDPFHTWMYRQVDAWIVPLQYHAENVMNRTKFTPERIKVIPFGLDLNELRKGLTDKREARKQLELPEEAQIVGVVGRIDPKKGQDTLIRAIKHLHDGGKQVHALIVGARTKGEATGFEADLHRLVRESGIESHVHFRPYLNQVANAYSAMDIFALTSHSETFGLVTLEAMACGVPVIGTDRSGTAAIIDHEKTGLLVPPRDAEALANAVSRLLDDIELREKISVASRSEIDRTYSHDVQVERLKTLLAELR